MKTKSIKMPHPVETLGGQPVKVTEKSTDFVCESIYESFQKLFSDTAFVKCIMVKTNEVVNLQFIGNGCVANMQIAEVRSNDALEACMSSQAKVVNFKRRKGGEA